MALIQCPECWNDVSDQAEACPKCGYPIKKSTQSSQMRYSGNPQPSQGYSASNRPYIPSYKPPVQQKQVKKSNSIPILIVLAIVLNILFVFSVTIESVAKSARSGSSTQSVDKAIESSSNTKETEKTSADSKNTNRGSSKTDSGSRNKDASDTSSKPKSNKADYEVTDTYFNYYLNSIGSVEYFAFVEITNTGSSNLYLGSATFDLEDINGHLLQSDDLISTAPDAIYPGEKGYYYNMGYIDEGVSLENGVKLVPSYKVEVARQDIVEYEVSDLGIKEDTFGFSVTGRVQNNTDEDDSYCYINILFYDASGKIAGITGTTITDLTAGSKKSFECSSMFLPNNLSINDVANYKVIARKMMLQF